MYKFHDKFFRFTTIYTYTIYIRNCVTINFNLNSKKLNYPMSS